MAAFGTAREVFAADRWGGKPPAAKISTIGPGFLFYPGSKLLRAVLMTDSVDPEKGPIEVLKELRADAERVLANPSGLYKFERRMVLYMQRFFGPDSRYEKHFSRIAFTSQRLRVRDVYSNPFDSQHEDALALKEGIATVVDLIDVMIEDLETDHHARRPHPEGRPPSRDPAPRSVVQHFHGPVGAVQQGAANSAEVRQDIGISTAELLSALKALQEAATAHGVSAVGITVIAEQAESEIKRYGITAKVKALLASLPGVVALAANLKPAYDSVKIAAKSAGLELPELGP